MNARRARAVPTREEPWNCIPLEQPPNEKQANNDGIRDLNSQPYSYPHYYAGGL